MPGRFQIAVIPRPSRSESKEWKEAVMSCEGQGGVGGTRSDQLALETGTSGLLVTPGQVITDSSAFMRGHGTYLTGDSNMVASVAGMVERVNKLVSVRALRCRYMGEIGDIVIGRITAVQQKRWKVDINGKLEANLQLSSINLPGGVQRRKSESDERAMRTFFREGDLLSAEVHGLYADGTASLHTRSAKYGKLRNGCLIMVQPALIKRAKSHFCTFTGNVGAILGLNGYIWVHKTIPTLPEMENALEGVYSDENDPSISVQDRLNMARVCNCIQMLAANEMVITETMIAYCLEASAEYPVGDLLNPEVERIVIHSAKIIYASSMQQ